jgi:hypothetical protein
MMATVRTSFFQDGVDLRGIDLRSAGYQCVATSQRINVRTLSIISEMLLPHRIGYRLTLPEKSTLISLSAVFFSQCKLTLQILAPDVLVHIEF